MAHTPRGSATMLMAHVRGHYSELARGDLLLPQCFDAAMERKHSQLEDVFALR